MNVVGLSFIEYTWDACYLCKLIFAPQIAADLIFFHFMWCRNSTHRTPINFLRNMLVLYFNISLVSNYHGCTKIWTSPFENRKIIFIEVENCIRLVDKSFYTLIPPHGNFITINGWRCRTKHLKFWLFLNKIRYFLLVGTCEIFYAFFRFIFTNGEFSEIYVWR